MKPRRVTIILTALLGLLVAVPPAQSGEKEGADFEGSVEFLYRNVGVSGSQRKYEEDFDGLTSGGRVSNLYLNWNDLDMTALDYARLNVQGLGGDPYQRVGFRFGRNDIYDVTFNYRKHAYLYNLFGLYGDEDGHSWDTNRALTDFRFTYHVTPKADVFFEYFDGQRSGNSVFMKDVQRDLFLMETPVNVREKRYAVGTQVEAGPVDIYFRQTLRRFENEFVNVTEGDLGLDQTDPAILNSYNWRQRDSGNADLTNLTVRADLGSRVDLTVGYFGTALGAEELNSQVDLDATGTDFNGLPFTVQGGFSDTTSEMDTTLLQADLSWIIVRPVIFHLQYRSLSRDLMSTGPLDVEGTGTPTLLATSWDWTIDTGTALLEVRPVRSLTFNLGYRVADRKLERDGFNDPARDGDFESDGDGSAVVGLAWTPARWFRLDARYEDAEIDQPFTNVSVFESSRGRIRLVFRPIVERMQIDLSYVDYENTNTATDFRPTGSFFGSTIEGQTWSASFWYRPTDWVDFLVRYTENEVDSVTSVIFDTAGFGGTEPGQSVYDDTNTEAFFRVGFEWAEAWKVWARYWMTESTGDNPLIGDVNGPVSCLPGGAGAVCNSAIGQDYYDAEVGLTYTFPSGIYFGGSFRAFDYDDINDLVDYDGNIVTLLAGMRF